MVNENRWSDSLTAADRRLNGGLSLELLSAETYAEMDKVTPEDYVVRVLRQERIRRQEQDRIVGDQALMDEFIDGALAAGLPIHQYVAKRLTDSEWSHEATFSPDDVSYDFLVKVGARMIERLREEEGAKCA